MLGLFFIAHWYTANAAEATQVVELLQSKKAVMESSYKYVASCLLSFLYVWFFYLLQDVNWYIIDD